MVLWKSGRNKNFNDLPLYYAKVIARAKVTEQMFDKKIFKNFLKRLDKCPNICYNIDNEREVNNMKFFKVEHKYCGATRLIKGNDFYHACKLYGLIRCYWKVVEEYEKFPKNY